LTISPIKDVHGRIIGASSIARDITAQVAAAKALREKNRELEFLNSITGALNSTLDMSDKLHKVLRDTLELVSADAG
jgi:nitrate/nitrite-specific signal transduction histidine kinase